MLVGIDFPLVVFVRVKSFIDERNSFQLDYRVCRNRQREDIGKRGGLLVQLFLLSLGNKEKYQYSVRGNLYNNIWY